jgi:hypothetical protein
MIAFLKKCLEREKRWIVNEKLGTGKPRIFKFPEFLQALTKD